MTIDNRNLHFQIIALVLMLMVLLFYAGRRKLRIARERVFCVLLWTSFVSLGLDIASVLVMRGIIPLPEYLSVFLRRTYLVSIVVVAFAVLLYTLAEVYLAEIFAKQVRYAFVLPLVISIPLILNLPVEAVLPKHGFGSAVYFSMGTTVIYLVIAWRYAYVHRQEINKNRLIAICLAGFSFFGCGIFQLFFQQWRLMSLGISIFVVFMYLGLENPDEYIDKHYDIFNSEACMSYMRNMCSEKRAFSICHIKFVQMDRIIGQSNDSIVGIYLKSYVERLKQIEGAQAFIVSPGEYIVCFEQPEHFMDKVTMIREMTSEPWKLTGDKSWLEIEASTKIVAFPQSRIRKDCPLDEIVTTMNYFMDKLCREGKDDYICIDRRQLREMEQYKHIREVLSKKLNPNQIDVVYQPVFAAYDNKYTEVEALLRIKDLDDRYLDTETVVSVLEQSGDMRDVGIILFEKVCEFVAGNRLDIVGVKKVSFNLSSVELQDRHLAETYIGIMDKYSVSAAVFSFEIGETSVLHSTRNLKRNINQLTSYGASVHIHDFGTTSINPDISSSMSGSALKLSRRLISDFFNGHVSRQYMRSLCRMLIQQKLTITAVGVENQYQYSELKKLGISQMQGYAFFKPMPGDEMLDALERERASGLDQEVLLERTL